MSESRRRTTPITGENRYQSYRNVDVYRGENQRYAVLSTIRRREYAPRRRARRAYSDLSTANPRLQTFDDLLYASNVAETEIDTIARRLIDEAEPIPSEDVGGESLIEPVTPGSGLQASPIGSARRLERPRVRSRSSISRCTTAIARSCSSRPRPNGSSDRTTGSESGRLGLERTRTRTRRRPLGQRDRRLHDRQRHEQPGDRG